MKARPAGLPMTKFSLAILALAIWVHGRGGGDTAMRPRLVAGGSIPIIAVLFWANAEFWTDFLPSRVYPGFPHGLELVLGPGLYAPIGMIAGVILALVIPRQ